MRQVRRIELSPLTDQQRAQAERFGRVVLHVARCWTHGQFDPVALDIATNNMLRSITLFKPDRGVKLSTYLLARLNLARFEYHRAKTRSLRSGLKITHQVGQDRRNDEWLSTLAIDDRAPFPARAAWEIARFENVLKLVSRQRGRTILRLVFLDGWALAEVSEMLGLSATQTTVIYRRSLEEIRRGIEPETRDFAPIASTKRSQTCNTSHERKRKP